MMTVIWTLKKKRYRHLYQVFNRMTLIYKHINFNINVFKLEWENENNFLEDVCIHIYISFHYINY